MNNVILEVPMEVSEDDSVEMDVSEGGGTNNYNDLNNLPKVNGHTLIGDQTSEELGINIPTDLSELNDDSTHRLVTDEEKQGWDNKADTSDIPTELSELTGDEDHRLVTDEQIEAWNSKAEVSDIPTDLSQLNDDSTHRLVTDTEKSAWDNKSDFDGQYNSLSGKPTLGTASAYNVPASGNAGQTEVVKGDDSRLTNARTPVSHTHTLSEITDSGTAAAKNFTTSVIDGSNDLVTSGAVHDAIENAIASVYKPSGNKTCAELVSALLVASNLGNVYNMTDSGVTTADFVEGAGKTIDAGDNVAIVSHNDTYKFDILSGMVDLSNYIQKSSTSGFVKNDGSIDTKQYVEQVQGKGLSTNDYDNTAKGIVDGVTSALADKVDKVQGKGLSTNDYDDNAKSIVDGVTSALADKVDKVEGKGLSTNDYDDNAKSIVDGVTSALADKVDKVDGKGLSTEDYTSTEKTKLGGISDNAKKVASSSTNGHIEIDDVDTTVYDDTAIKNALSTDTTIIEGNPLSFTTLTEQTAESTLIDLEPIQDLHGYDKPWVGGTGKNKLPLVLSDIKAANTSGTWVNNEYTENGVKFVVNTDSNDNITSIKAEGTASANSTLYLIASSGYPSNVYKSMLLNGCSDGTSSTYMLRAQYSNNGTTIATEANQFNDDLTILSNYDYVRFNIRVQSGTTVDIEYYPMIRESGQSATFAPYSNLCPISGRSEIGILGTNGKESTDPDYEISNDLTISLGQTVYGGSLDVENGVLVVDRILGDKDNFTNFSGPSSGGLKYAEFASNTIKLDGKIICNMLETKKGTAAWESTTPCIQQSNTGQRIRCYVTETDLNTFKTNYADISYVYELATPITIQLTPHEISLLEGVNNISTDGDKITLTYRNGKFATMGDVKTLADEMSQEIADSQILTDTVTGDKYRLVVTNGVLDIEQVSN